jgi:hypothetical protein
MPTFGCPPPLPCSLSCSLPQDQESLVKCKAPACLDHWRRLHCLLKPFLQVRSSQEGQGLTEAPALLPGPGKHRYSKNTKPAWLKNR